MHNNIIIVMSLMGSTVFLLYLLLKPLLKRFFSVSTRITLLKISMYFFILPTPLLKNYYRDFINIVTNHTHNSTIKATKIKFDKTISVFPDGSIMISKLNLFLILSAAVWAVVVIIFSINNNKNYKNLKKFTLDSSNHTTDEYVQGLADKYRKELNIKRDILVLYSDFLEPMTLGFIKPIIVLPNNNLDMRQIEFIIKHEIVHIYHNDFLTKILMIIACIMHLFNPLIYLLRREMSIVIENHCDELVVIDLNDDERKLYGNTIIELSTENSNKKYNNYKIRNTPISSFGSTNDEKIINERITEMRNVKRHKKLSFVISFLLLITVVMLNSVFVFAYKEITSEVWSENYPDDIIIEDYFTSDNLFDSKGICDHDESDECLDYFVDEDSQVYIFTESSQEKVLCNHNYVDGYKVLHALNDTGGCKEYYYHATFCTKCGTAYIGSLANTIYYQVCNH